MTTERLQEVLCCELPEAYAALLPRFQEEWEQIRLQPLFETEAVEKLIEEGFIDGACMADVNACLARIQQDEALCFALQFLFHVLCVYRKPWQNEFYAHPIPETLGEYRFTFSFIVLLRTLQKSVNDARARGIPEEMVAQMKGAADCGRGEPWGLRTMFHWFMSCALGTMFYVGTFRYELERMPEGYRMFRRKKDGRLLTLWAAERRFDEFGQFTHLDELTAFRTSAPKNAFDGYLIRPDGVVLDRYVQLSDEEWEIAFVEGDMALSFHIPPKTDYTHEAVKKTFSQAVAFYRTYFPELNIRGIQSYSWLYSPQLKEILPPTSGINRLNEQLYLCPVPSGADGFYCFVFDTDAASFDPNTAKTDTSLRRLFVEFVKRGGRAHNGFMYVPADDAERLGRDLYCNDLF